MPSSTFEVRSEALSTLVSSLLPGLVVGVESSPFLLIADEEASIVVTLLSGP